MVKIQRCFFLANITFTAIYDILTQQLQYANLHQVSLISKFIWNSKKQSDYKLHINTVAFCSQIQAYGPIAIYRKLPKGTGKNQVFQIGQIRYPMGDPNAPTSSVGHIEFTIGCRMVPIGRPKPLYSVCRVDSVSHRESKHLQVGILIKSIKKPCPHKD